MYTYIFVRFVGALRSAECLEQFSIADRTDWTVREVSDELPNHLNVEWENDTSDNIYIYVYLYIFVDRTKYLRFFELIHRLDRKRRMIYFIYFGDFNAGH